jgi:hypothetical protein
LRFCTPPRLFCRRRWISRASDTFFPSGIFCAQLPAGLSRDFCERTLRAVARGFWTPCLAAFSRGIRCH